MTPAAVAIVNAVILAAAMPAVSPLEVASEVLGAQKATDAMLVFGGTAVAVIMGVVSWLHALACAPPVAERAGPGASPFLQVAWQRFGASCVRLLSEPFSSVCHLRQQSVQ